MYNCHKTGLFARECRNKYETGGGMDGILEIRMDAEWKQKEEFNAMVTGSDTQRRDKGFKLRSKEVESIRVSCPSQEVQPKVWSDAPIIEEYESDSDDDHCNGVRPVNVFQKTPSFTIIKAFQKNNSTKNKFFKTKVYTAKVKEVSTVGEKWDTAVKSSAGNKLTLLTFKDFNGALLLWRFSWTFFLRTKDETSAILKDFIRQIENQLNQKVKTIRCDNGTEFKNRDVIEFCGLKGIKREYSNARTPQQNGVAERKNRTLIEAARTMLADSFLPNTFWAEAVSTACYVLNRVLVTKPHNKTPYELLTGKTPIISYIRPFGCHVTILNTIDHLGKFAGKSDEGFLVGYSLQSKAFRVYNLVTKRVEENLHINFLENKPNVAGKGPTWLFDLDYLTDSMNYHSVRSENQANIHAGQQESNQNTGTKDKINAGDSEKEDESAQDCFELPIWHSYSSTNILGRHFSGILGRQLANISVPLDHFLVNRLTSKVFSFMIKKGKHFSGKVIPLFDTTLVQPTQDESASSERLSVEQPSPSPAPTGEIPNESL
ncbi:ribonuclease H-like domain-containing protein, partial [Tanacetum coccineum]